MNKKLKSILMLLLVCLLLTGCVSAAPDQGAAMHAETVQGEPTQEPVQETAQASLQEEAQNHVQDTAKDYAAVITLNMGSETVKQQVSVKTFIDGDTTHFLVPESVVPSGVLKARFLAVNTPETTGLVEEYGKRASRFTKEKLTNAESIIIESDDGTWNLDSTGERHLVWVWYKPAGEKEYRNLNIELLQNGLAKANSSAQNRYGSTCMSAIQQAKDQKLSIYSGEKDPDFFYGDAVEMTIKELRRDPEKYNGVKVAFSGIVALNSDSTVFVEEYDAETGMYYGMAVYYGYGLNGAGLEILNVGNEARIVGTLQYYEAGGQYPADQPGTRRCLCADCCGYIPKWHSSHGNGSGDGRKTLCRNGNEYFHQHEGPGCKRYLHDHRSKQFFQGGHDHDLRTERHGNYGAHRCAAGC